MNKAEEALVYKAKQDWLDAVMASELSPATKVFAYGVFKRMYGTKTQAHPDTIQLIEDTGLSRSKFSEYRQTLFEAGALRGVKDRKARGRQANYTYWLLTDWDGQVPSGDTQVPSGDSEVPSGDTQVPRGCSNTTSNTTTNTTSKTTREEASADAAAGKPLSNSKDDADSSLTSEVPVLPLTQEDAVVLDPDSKVPLVPTGDLKPFHNSFVDEYTTVLAQRTNGQGYDKGLVEKAKTMLLDRGYRPDDLSAYARVTHVLQDTGLKEPW